MVAAAARANAARGMPPPICWVVAVTPFGFLVGLAGREGWSPVRAPLSSSDVNVEYAVRRTTASPDGLQITYIYNLL